MKTIILNSVCFLAACLMFAGCNKMLGEGVTLSGIETDSNLRLHIGNEYRLHAYPVPWDCTDYYFTWESLTPDIVKIDKVGNAMIIGFGTGKVKVSNGGQFAQEVSIDVYEISLKEKLEPLKPKGFWEFEDLNDLFKPTIGDKKLEPSPTSAGKWEQINGYNSRKKAIRTVPTVTNADPALAEPNHLAYNHKWPNTPGTAGGINEYTIMIDVCLPGASGGFFNDAGTWSNGSNHFCILQTDPNFRNEPSLFLRNNGEFGFRGVYSSVNDIRPVRDRWYRFVFCAKVEREVKYFVNSLKYNTANPGNVGPNNQFAEGGVATWRGAADGTPPVFFFGSRFASADNGSAANRLYVAALAVWDRVLTDEEVRSIGNIPQY